MMEKNILITGYGPFGEHAINASWEAVKLIQEDAIPGFNIIKHEIPCAYKYINENVKEWWKMYQPEFVLHVGVNTPLECISLESAANRTGYVKMDVDGEFHPTGDVCAPESGPDILHPKINVDRICEQLNSEKLKFITSCDAGRYLCEYIFYTSLNIDNEKILFAHVPVLNEPYSAQELAEGLTMIIHAALEQLNEVNCA